MQLEVTGLGVDYIIKALSYQESKLMDQVGEFNKMNQHDLKKGTQREAEIVNALRVNIESQRAKKISLP